MTAESERLFCIQYGKKVGLALALATVANEAKVSWANRETILRSLHANMDAEAKT